jgi:hypothetical protein
MTFVLAFGFACQNIHRSSGQDYLRVAQAATRSSLTPLPVLNNIAFEFALATSPSPEALNFAQALAERVVNRQPTEPSYIDTLAMVLYRKGEVDGAVALERRAISFLSDAKVKAKFGSRLGLMLLTRLTKTGPLELGAQAHAGDFDISIEKSSEVSDGTRAYVIDAHGKRYPSGVTVYALVRQTNNAIGLLWLHLRRGQTIDVLRLKPGQAPYPRAFKNLPDDVRVDIAMVDTGDNAANTLAYPLEWNHQSIDTNAMSMWY